MRRYSVFMVLALSLTAGTVQANYRHQPPPADDNGVNTDVVVDLPPEVWTQGQRRQQACVRCCIFDNRNYSEGSVVKSEGVLLQCARDEQSLGTNNLIWKIVK